MMAKFKSIQECTQGTKESASRFGPLAAPIAGSLMGLWLKTLGQ